LYVPKFCRQAWYNWIFYVFRKIYVLIYAIYCHVIVKCREHDRAKKKNKKFKKIVYAIKKQMNITYIGKKNQDALFYIIYMIHNNIIIYLIFRNHIYNYVVNNIFIYIYYNYIYINAKVHDRESLYDVFPCK